MAPVRIAVGPAPADWVSRAIEGGGGVPVSVGEAADGLVWLDSTQTAALRAVLEAQPALRWVQLPEAGVEAPLDSGLFDGRRQWTSGKGSYAEPVAEHALMLALAGLRDLPRRIRATTWGKPGGTVLWDEAVTILGAGGVAETLITLLAPYRCRVTVVRRMPRPVPGAARTLPPDRLDEALPDARVVFLALALTPETRGIIGAAELQRMDRGAWLVNVARGAHVDTAALVEALGREQIAGAALDVTDPEPLPDGHPLWSLPNCIITPHTANSWEMLLPPFSERIRTNVARFASGEPLVGLVDVAHGY